MRRLSVVLAVVAIMALGATSEVTCTPPNVVVITPPLRVVTIQYLNDAEGDVAVTLLAHGDDDKDEDDLEEDGRDYYTLLPAGGEDSLVFDCDRAGSIMIDRAKLFVVGDIGPSIGTDAYHIGEDYECGDTITFNFYNNPAFTDLYVDVFLN